MIIKSSIVGRFTWEKSEQFNDILWCHHWFSQEMTSEPGGGGGTPKHYLYGYLPPKGVVILNLLI